MERASVDVVRIGHVEVDLDTATAWVGEYTDVARNREGGRPYAFPAYDHFDSGSADPGVLTDADLLAPVLLNVQVKIRSFYALQRIRGRLEEGLRNPVLEGPLAAADPVEMEVVIRNLYGVLDVADAPWGIGGTKLSKVLHRKRPQSLVLHDRWVRACYVGDGAPVRQVRGRGWADYMVLITKAIRNDVATQPDAFRRLRDAASEELSDVRLLDILAWKSQGESPSDELEDLTSETGDDMLK